MGLKTYRLLGWLILVAQVATGGTLPAQPVAKTRVALAAAAGEATTNEDGRLMALFRADARRSDALDPLSALYRGGTHDTSVFTRLYTVELDRQTLTAVRQALTDLRSIDRRKLSPERQLSYDVFLRDKREDEAWLQPAMLALTAVRPINHFGGLQVEFPAFMSRDGALPYASEADYRRNLALERAFPVVVGNIVARFRQGMASGVTDSKITTRIMIAQIEAILAQPVEASPFYSPVAAFPARVPRRFRSELRSAYAETIRSDLYPAYRQLRDFLNDEYLPAARDKVGISALPGGAALYARMIERQTTLKLDPDAVHRLGLSEVARIQREMASVARELGFTGPLPAFFEELRSNPKYHPRSAAELRDGYVAVARRVDALAPQYFSRMPRARLLIEPYPAYRARYEAGGSYDQGASDGSRPGVFYFNTYDLPSRFLTGIDTLYLHEGAPGHHFQISLAQENVRLPDFQRFDGNSAFVEGWALYAETLGYQMGLYQDPLQHWGTLDDEMLRAMRLVVDTGLHTQGWSREQAVTYMLANSGMGRSDAEAEVDRYIAWPAQALSYKIGALTIQRLRAKAETALGAKFDLRAFHDQVLGSGALPLPILEAKIDRWIAATR